MDLKIVSFNCNSARKNTSIIQELLLIYDIVLLQETFLIDEDINYLSNLNTLFEFAAVPSLVNLNSDFRGRPIGGLAILWKKSLNSVIRPIIVSNRIMGIELLFNEKQTLLLNAYFPCDYRDLNSLVAFRETLIEVSNTIDFHKFDSFILAGDINCDPLKGRFYSELTDFITAYHLTIADVELLPNDSFSYISSGNCTATSWLDHVITSDPSIVTNIKILYGLSFSDHIPISFSLILPATFNFTINTSNCDIFPDFVPWHKLQDDDIVVYQRKLHAHLNSYLNSSLMCYNKSCTSITHKKELDKAFDFLKNSIFDASKHMTYSGNSKFNINDKQVVGWNDHCKKLHATARTHFLNWIANGKMRVGNDYEKMKETRRAFKSALDYCRRNENNIKNDKIMRSFASKNKSLFWKTINKMKNNVNDSVHIIDNETDTEKILNIFTSKYKNVLDDPLCQLVPCEQNVNKLNNLIIENREKIFSVHVVDAMDSLNIGIGWDLVHTNHLKYGGDSLNRFLAKLFSAWINHSYVPRSLMFGEIRPILKDKMQNKFSSDNYRPVMSSSNFLKLFEYCILDKLNFNLNPRQFGFRRNTSCLMTVSVLKETIAFYNSKNSKVYSCFIDLKKTFDKVNYNVLIDKLIDRNVSPNLIFIIKNMLEQQYVRLVFHNKKGKEWKIGNGVRQGGILSPLLFNFYINDIINEISELSIGCTLDFYIVNILAFADDIVLNAPSANGLQFLIDKFFTKINKISLIINESKTKCMIFDSKRSRRNLELPCFYVNNCKIDIVKNIKYLGVELSDDSFISSDIKKCNLVFMKQFYSIWRKFYFTDFNVFKFLFTSHCMSFFGAELWFNMKNSKQEFHALEIAYHKAIKKMLGLPWRESNHYACEVADMPVFKHFINQRILGFLFNLINSKSLCVAPLRNYFRSDSFLVKHVKQVFNDVYSIDNLFFNDINAIKARIRYVDRHESRNIIY